MATTQPIGAQHARAFTLIELIVTLTIISTMLSIGIPGIIALASNSRITSAINNMVRHLHYARSEAVTRGVSVILCPSLQGDGCDDSFHWQQGFILFADSNGDRNLGSGEVVLRHVSPGLGETRIFTSPGRKKLTFQASGMAMGSTATITVCDSSGRAKAIILSNPGRPRLADTRADGSPLVCI